MTRCDVPRPARLPRRRGRRGSRIGVWQRRGGGAVVGARGAQLRANERRLPRRVRCVPSDRVRQFRSGRHADAPSDPLASRDGAPRSARRRSAPSARAPAAAAAASAAATAAAYEFVMAARAMIPTTSPRRPVPARDCTCGKMLATAIVFAVALLLRAQARDGSSAARSGLGARGGGGGGGGAGVSNARRARQSCRHLTSAVAKRGTPRGEVFHTPRRIEARDTSSSDNDRRARSGRGAMAASALAFVTDGIGALASAPRTCAA